MNSQLRLRYANFAIRFGTGWIQDDPMRELGCEAHGVCQRITKQLGLFSWRKNCPIALIMSNELEDIHPLFHGAPKTTEFRKLRKRIIRNAREAIDQYGMVQDRKARWLVCLSGGKDSYTLLAALYELKWRGLLPVEILACNLDQGQPGFPATVLPAFLKKMGVPHRIEYQDTYSIVIDKVPQGRTFCALCSRLRRGNLYRIAREEGCSAVVLGHHRDDILETFFMNIFHGGRLATMPPKLVNEEGDLFVLRPLAHVAEQDCERFAREMSYPIIPCDLCGSQDGLQRQQVKQILDSWEKNHPGRRQVMFRALQNARPSHLLDSKLWDFSELALTDGAVEEGVAVAALATPK